MASSSPVKRFFVSEFRGEAPRLLEPEGGDLEARIPRAAKAIDEDAKRRWQAALAEPTVASDGDEGDDEGDYATEPETASGKLALEHQLVSKIQRQVGALTVDDSDGDERAKAPKPDSEDASRSVSDSPMRSNTDEKGEVVNTPSTFKHWKTVKESRPITLQDAADYIANLASSRAPSSLSFGRNSRMNQNTSPKRRKVVSTDATIPKTRNQPANDVHVRYGEEDIARRESAFQNWLAKKAKPKRQQAVETIASENVDIRLKEESFKEWLREKEALRKRQEDQLARQKRLEEKREARKAEQKKATEVKAKEARAQWLQRKKELSEAEKRAAERAQRLELERKSVREKRGKEAFEKWKSQKAENGWISPVEEHIYKHEKGWTQILARPAKPADPEDAETIFDSFEDLRRSGTLVGVLRCPGPQNSASKKLARSSGAAKRERSASLETPVVPPSLWYCHERLVQQHPSCCQKYPYLVPNAGSEIQFQ